MKEPVEHVERPLLPWRPTATVTECGHDASKVATVTRAVFLQRLKDYGVQRTMLLTCMTCYRTAERWMDWEHDPREALLREIQWEGHGKYAKQGVVRDELRAIAALIAAHPEEFATLVERERWNNRLDEKRKANQ